MNARGSVSAACSRRCVKKIEKYIASVHQGLTKQENNCVLTHSVLKVSYRTPHTNTSVLVDVNLEGAHATANSEHLDTPDGHGCHWSMKSTVRKPIYTMAPTSDRSRGRQGVRKCGLLPEVCEKN